MVVQGDRIAARAGCPAGATSGVADGRGVREGEGMRRPRGAVGHCRSDTWAPGHLEPVLATRRGRHRQRHLGAAEVHYTGGRARGRARTTIRMAVGVVLARGRLATLARAPGHHASRGRDEREARRQQRGNQGTDGRTGHGRPGSRRPESGSRGALTQCRSGCGASLTRGPCRAFWSGPTPSLKLLGTPGDQIGLCQTP